MLKQDAKEKLRLCYQVNHSLDEADQLDSTLKTLLQELDTVAQTE